MSDRPVIYLAGPVAALDDGGATWRDDVAASFDRFEFHDPVARHNAPLDDLQIVDDASHGGDEVVSVSEIVETDKHLLAQSDAVVVGYSAVKSVGTPMEVMWAHDREMPVALWLRDDTPIGELSPWYRYHCDVATDSVELALGHLERALGGDGDE